METQSAKPVVVVTGSTGLIGSALCRDLASDHTVVGVDVERPAETAASAFVACDLTSDESVARAMAEIQQCCGTQIASVVHLAAYYDFAGRPSPLYRELTVEGTRRLLRALSGFETQQFVFSSTLLVMEPSETEGAELTEASPIGAEWDYPRSKVEAEKVIAREHGDIPAVILRIAGVYDEDCDSIPIAQQTARIYERRLESFLFPGDASHGQPFVHRDDLVECFRRVIQMRSTLGDHEIFLIGEPEVATHAALQEEIGRLVHGREWPTLRIPKLVAKVGAWAKDKLAGEGGSFIKPWMVDLADDHYPIEIRRAREKLGWNPRHHVLGTLPEMIRRLKADPAAWYRRNGIEPPSSLRKSASS